MLIHLVRHAHAGSRASWEGDDEIRPLSPKGELQAVELGIALAEMGPTRLWTSRYLRCRQTLEPLAERTGLEILDHPTLLEGEYGPPALEALVARAMAGETVVACSHGDVIPAIVAAAVRRGADLEGPAALQKAARYEMTVDGDTVTTITHVPRPEV